MQSKFPLTVLIGDCNNNVFFCTKMYGSFAKPKNMAVYNKATVLLRWP